MVFFLAKSHFDQWRDGLYPSLRFSHLYISVFADFCARVMYRELLCFLEELHWVLLAGREPCSHVQNAETHTSKWTQALMQAGLGEQLNHGRSTHGSYSPKGCFWAPPLSPAWHSQVQSTQVQSLATGVHGCKGEIFVELRIAFFIFIFFSGQKYCHFFFFLINLIRYNLSLLFSAAFVYFLIRTDTGQLVQCNCLT